MSALDKRIALEKKVVREIGRRAFAKGYTFNVFTGGDTFDNDAPITKLKDLWDHACACDESVLKVYNADGVRVGSLFLVFGNDGWDLVADHTDTDEISALVPDFEPEF